MTREDRALRELRAKGVANQKAAAAAEEKAAAEKRTQVASAGKNATSALGRFANKEWWVFPGAISVPGTILVIAGVLWPTKRIPGGDLYTEYLRYGGVTLGIAALFAALILLAGPVVRRAYAREVAWVASLPFKVENHLTYYEKGYGRCRLVFAGTAPDKDTLAPLVAGLDGRNPIKLDTRDNVPTLQLDRSELSGHARWRDWHNIVDSFLLPLHAKYPLAAVSFA